MWRLKKKWLKPSNKKAWTRSAIINIANMGYFSSDRSVMDYAKNIWHIEPMSEEQLKGDSTMGSIIESSNKLLNLK
ncbi:glycogen/starch/alpha-glucan phosphorylase [Mannheimia haemolytica]